MLRMSEKGLFKKDLCICFLDCTKAFDKIGHEEMLQNINVDGKDIQQIQNLYWEQTAAIRINN